MAMTREQERAIALARVRRQRQQKEEGGLSPVQGAGDAAALGAIRGATFGFLDEAASGIDYLLDKLPTRQGRSYEELLRQNRNEQTAADERFPVASTLGQVAGSLAVPLGATSQGLNIAGRGSNLLAKGLGYAGEGAAYGALAGAGNADDQGLAENVGRGFLWGGGLGLAAPVAVAGASRAVQPVVDSVRNSFGPASSQAAQRIGSQLRATNLADADVTQRLGELGPEGILADVMGARGQALARSASNVSPEARQTIEGFTGPRNATRNERVVGAIEDAAGLPAGSRQTVDDLKAAAYAQQEPAINAAYREARALGYDLPLESFQEIIGSPLGSRTFREASKAVQNRMAAGDEGAASNLGLLDAMKRRLDAVGRVAGRAGDNDAASQATMLSNALRRQMDELLDAPQYAQARSMREAAYRTDDAFDQGAALAARRVPFDAASGARGGGQGPVRPEVAQGYAATIAQDLLNQPGGLDRLSAPLQREAMETALQGGSKRVQDQLARERVFQDTHRSVVGNSTTARQLKEMGVIAGAGTGLGVLGGLDIQQAGMAGIAAALLKRGGGAAVSKLRSGNEEKVAQEIANMLIGRGVPTTPQGVSVALRNPERARTIARILTGTGGAMAGQ